MRLLLQFTASLEILAQGSMKHFSILNSQLSTLKGFTLVEVILTMSVFLILLGIVTLNLNTARTQATLSTTLETLIADLNQQQIKAMVGDTEGRTEMDTYGIHFATDSYTLFHGTYSESEPSNFSISLPNTQEVSTTFPNSQIIFLEGSGEISGYNANNNTITVRDTNTGEQRTIEFNRYGVVTRVN